MKAKEWTVADVKPGAYLIEGEDGFWVRYALERFTESVPEYEREFGIKRVESLKTFDALEDACRSLSLFGGGCLVIVADGGYKEKSGDTDRFRSLLEGSENTVVFVGVALPRGIKAKCTRIDCNRLPLPEAIAEITARFPFLKGRAAALLAEYTGRDMDRMVTEGKKLQAWADGAAVREEDVKALVSNTVENEIYEFTGALAAGNSRTAMEILERFQAKGTSSVYLLSALTGQYRRMFYAAVSDLPSAELAAVMGVKEYAVIKARETARKYTKKGLKRNLDVLTEAEYAFKSGKMSEDTALKQAVGKLLQEAR